MRAIQDSNESDEPLLQVITQRTDPAHHRHSFLDVLDSQAGRQRLLELVRLLQILDAQGVEVLAAADLELDDVLRLLDLDGCA